MKDNILSSNRAEEGFLDTKEIVTRIEQLLAAGSEPEWDPAALKGLESIPTFVRQRVQAQLTALAKQQGIGQITAEIFVDMRLKMMQNMGGSQALSGGRLAPELQTLPLSPEAKEVLIKYPEFMQKEMLPALHSQAETETPLEQDTVSKIAAETLERMRERFASFQDKLPVGGEAPGFTLPDLAGQPHSLSDTRGSWTVLEFGAFT